jgi:putative transposase
MDTESSDTQILTYAYKLLPNLKQRKALERISEQQRMLYNAALEERISAYTKAKKSISINDQSKSLTIIRADDPDFADVQRRIQRNTLNKLDLAFKAFFKRAKQGKGAASGFPSFKGYDRWMGFGFDAFEQIKFDGKRVRFSGMPGGLRVAVDRPIPEGAEFKGVWFKKENRTIADTNRVSRNGIGCVWFVGFQLKMEAPKKRAKGKEIGLDWGTSVLAALSTGEFIPNPRPAEKAHAEIRRVSRKLSRAKMLRGTREPICGTVSIVEGTDVNKGVGTDTTQVTKGVSGSAKCKGRGRVKARALLQKAYRKITNKRKNYLDKVSARLTKQFKLIALEKLAVQRMVSKPDETVPDFIRRRRNREALDAAPAKFRHMIVYKAVREGSESVEVDAKNTTTPCHVCGHLVHKTLSDVMHDCPKCGTRINRKVNAARVILKLSRAGRSPEDANQTTTDCPKNTAGKTAGARGESPLPSVVPQATPSFPMKNKRATSEKGRKKLKKE